MVDYQRCQILFFVVKWLSFWSRNSNNW